MRLWTLKEAYVKALGTGIAAHPLKGFDVELLTSDDGEDEDAEDEARARGSAETGRASSSGSGGTPGGTTPRAARVRLTERSGSSESERSAWARSAGSWRFALVRPRRGANEIASVCAWIEEGGGERRGETARGREGREGLRGARRRWSCGGRCPDGAGTRTSRGSTSWSPRAGRGRRPRGAGGGGGGGRRTLFHHCTKNRAEQREFTSNSSSVGWSARCSTVVARRLPPRSPPRSGGALLPSRVARVRLAPSPGGALGAPGSAPPGGRPLAGSRSKGVGSTPRSYIAPSLDLLRWTIPRGARTCWRR